MADEKYRDFIITYDPPPIPVRNCDWHYYHKDIDLDDNRYGHCASLDECKAEIDEWYEEQEA